MNGTKDTVDPASHLVSFDATNPTGAWINDTGPQTGSCTSLACHGAQTPEWYGAGSNLPDCTTCHAGSYDPVNIDASKATGKHQIHYANYQIACLKCHFGYTGYPSHMNGTLDSSISGVPLVYFDVTNPLAQWLNATENCANTYCHSNGTSVATGTIPSNTSPSWTTPGPLPCNSCHGNTTYTDWRKAAPLYAEDQPKSNSHYIHTYSIECKFCHYSVTRDNTTIADFSKHANGVYDVVPDPVDLYSGVSVSFNYSYDPGGGSCSNISCHQLLKGWYGTFTWGGYSGVSVNSAWAPTSNCWEIRFYNVSASGGTPPYTYSWDFGDGTTSTEQNPTHVFPSGSTYTVTLSARDVNRHLATKISTITPQTSNTPPVADLKIVSVFGYTVTIQDLSYDPDYNTCGHSGSAQINIGWWDPYDLTRSTQQYISLTNSASNTTYTYTYNSQNAPTTVWITDNITDNAGTLSYKSLPVGIPHTYTVGGRVTNAAGVGLQGAIVYFRTMGGAAPPFGTSALWTDANGYYTISGTAVDGVCYVVKQPVLPGYTFTPGDQTVCAASTSVNFTSSQ